MWHEHASGAAYQSLEVTEVRQKQIDVVADEGRRNREPICGGVLQPHGEDYTEFIEVVETFKFLGRMLNRSYYDCRSVLLNVGKAHQVCSRLGKLLRIGGIPESVSNVILGSGAGSATLWGRDLGFIIGNVHLYGGCECGFPQTVEGAEDHESGRQDLEKRGIGKGSQGSGYSDTWDVY